MATWVHTWYSNRWDYLQIFHLQCAIWQHL